MAPAAPQAPPEVTREMYDDLKNLVSVNQEENEKDFKNLKDKNSSLEARMNDAEA